MLYSLSSSRKYGDYQQKVMVTHGGSATTSGSSELTLLKSWVTAFASLDNSTWEKEDAIYNVMTEADDGVTTVVGSKGDIDVCVVCKVSGKPKMVTFTVKEVTVSGVATAITNKVTALLGVTITTSDTGVVNASVNLHD